MTPADGHFCSCDIIVSAVAFSGLIRVEKSVDGAVVNPKEMSNTEG